MIWRKLYLFLLLALLSLNVLAQKYGNEWVAHSQTYFKFPITKEGIYRIDSTALANIFNLQTLNPNNLQLFVKGKEQFLFIKGDGDNQININDYVEFYASPFRRDFDSLLYVTGVNYVPSPYLPLFNDTIFGFITVNNSVANKRYQIETDTTIANYPAGDHYYSELVYSPNSNYNTVADIQNTASDPRYTQADAWGYYFVKGSTLSSNFSNLSVYSSSVMPCYLQINYTGSNMDINSSIDHEIQTSYNDNLNNTVVLADSLFYGYSPIRQTFTLSNSTIGNTTNFALLSVNNFSFGTNVNQTLLNALVFKYPKSLTLSNNLYNSLLVDDVPSFLKQGFVLSNPNVGTTNTIVAYDITNGKKNSD